LEGSGLSLQVREVITPHVLRALDADNRRKQAMIGGLVRRLWLRIFHQFAGMQGSEVYQRFRAGSMVYLRHVLQKPA